MPVDLAASGMCHSDEHVVTGASPVRASRSSAATRAPASSPRSARASIGLEEGDHVVTAFIPACGVCPACSNGQQNLCDLGMFLLRGESIADSTFRVQGQGPGRLAHVPARHLLADITVHQASVVKIEKDLPLEKAALVGCGVSTGWGTATTVGDVRPGETVVVMGAGGVGMNAVQGAAAAGAKHVVVIDPVAAKREWAMDFGATHTFENAEQAIEEVNELTYGRMAEKALITVGDIHGEDIEIAMGLIGKGGRVVVTGMGNCAEHGRQAQPVHVHAAAEGPAGRHLRRHQPAQGDPLAALALPRGQAQARRAGHDAPTRSRTSTRATRTCATARTSAASSPTRTPTGSKAAWKRPLGPALTPASG